MLDSIFQSVISTSITAGAFFACTGMSLLLGALVACATLKTARSSKSFLMTVALLPAIAQVVIMMVNGNLGAGVAVAGAFGLIRFRSAPGTAYEISYVFLATAVGLATGMGYIGLAAVFTVIILLFGLLYARLDIGGTPKNEKELKITIPESLDYAELFNDLFARYTDHVELIRSKTSNMGSLYQLTYRITLKKDVHEKEMIDDLRCRNGNLDITCGYADNSLQTL